MDNIIQSPSGKRMFGYISPIYYSSRVMQMIMEKNGREIDDLQAWIPDIQKQLFPQTATWGLRYWEELVGLPTYENESYQVRRSRVMSKIQERWPITVERMEKSISNSISNTSGEITVEIVQNVADYTFRVDFYGQGEPLSLIDAAKTINKVKPAHLAYQLCVANESELQAKTDYRRYLFQYIPCNTVLCGLRPKIATLGKALNTKINIKPDYKPYTFKYPLAGVNPRPATIGKIQSLSLDVSIQFNNYKFVYSPCGTLLCGTYP